MQTTMELWDRAKAVRTPAEWARALGVHITTFTRAKNDQHLPAAVAAGIAIELGEDPKEWIVTAALESTKNPTLRERVVRHLNTARKSLLSSIKRRRKH